MSKKPPDPTPDQLRQIAPDICHEVTALIQARDLHDHAKRQKDAAITEAGKDACQVGINCALESFLLHYRALREFLNLKAKLIKNGVSDDIKASDYLAAWKASLTWVSDEAEGERLNKRLAHITTGRIKLDNKWNPEQMEWNALRTFEEFISALPDTHKPLFQLAAAHINQRKPKVLSTLAESSNTCTVATYTTFGDFRFK